MGRLFQEEKKFSGIDYSGSNLPKGDYEDCVFTECNFTNSDLSGNNFGSCEFVECDLSMVNITGITLREARFMGCKLLGLNFESCNEILFSFDFYQCQLDLSSFHRRSLVRTNFTECRLHEVDFTGADVTGSVFHRCDLSGAIFINSILEKVDFRTSDHYSIDPELNRIKKARFSSTGVIGLLGKYDIIID